VNGAAELQREKEGGTAVVFFGIVIAALALLGLPFTTAWNSSPDLGHGWALPWLIGWLLWERRAALVAVRPGPLRWPAWAGLAGLAVMVLVLRLLLGAYPLLPTALWTLGFVFVGFALAAAVLAGGFRAMSALAMPVVLILAGLPWPSVVENAVVFPLREMLAVVTVEVLNAFDVPSLANGTVIQLPGGTVGVDEACGGMRSLQASIMIALFVGEAAWLHWRRRLALLGLAVATAVMGNLFRVGLLTCAAHTGGETRLHAWHDPAGYLALICTLLVVGGLGWRWGGKAALLEPSSSGKWSQSPRVGKGKLAWAVTALVIVALIELFVRHWYGAKKETLADQPEWRVAWPVHADGFHEDLLGKTGQELLRADEYAAASWKAQDGNARSAYFIEWRTGQKARFLPLLHNPEICLSMMGSKLLGRFDMPPVRIGRLELPFAGYEFSREGQVSHVFSILWDMDEARAFVPPPAIDGWMTVFRARWVDVMARRARVRVEVCTYQVIGATSREDAEAKFRREMEGGFLVETVAGAPKSTGR